MIRRARQHKLDYDDFRSAPVTLDNCAARPLGGHINALLKVAAKRSLA
jgi:hypothetical protein